MTDTPTPEADAEQARTASFFDRDSEGAWMDMCTTAKSIERRWREEVAELKNRLAAAIAERDAAQKREIEGGLLAEQSVTLAYDERDDALKRAEQAEAALLDASKLIDALRMENEYLRRALKDKP